MKTPYEILSAGVHISNLAYDRHIARKHIALKAADELAHLLVDKAFAEPIIIRAGWTDVEDYHKMYTNLICNVRWMPFKDWAVENLRAGQEDEFGRVLEIPLTDECMILRRENFLYTK